jgi:hypothetical protein
MHSTYDFYKTKYPEGQHSSVQEFVSGYFTPEETNNVEGVVDVYCDPPFAGWKE